HSIVNVANNLDIPLFGSNTLSDQALMPFPSVKIGPGDSIRSHTADEFIYVDEIKTGIKKYIHLINNLANETLG
ncbi:MAG: acetylornithine deacetylase, partial [Fluviicola sp.]